jgi:hypothetical protein
VFRERPDDVRRRRDQALSCSTVKAPTAAAATAISTSWPSPERFELAATALATIRWSSGRTCPPPDRHWLPIGASAAAAGIIHSRRLYILTINLQHDHLRDRCRDHQEMKAVTTGPDGHLDV